MDRIVEEFEGLTEPDAMIRTWRYSGEDKNLKEMLGEQTLPGTPPPWLLLLERTTLSSIENFISALAAHFGVTVTQELDPELVGHWKMLLTKVDEELFGQVHLAHLLHYVMQQAYFEYTQNIYRQAVSLKRLDKQLDTLGSEYKRVKQTLRRLEKLDPRRTNSLSSPYVFKHFKTDVGPNVVRRAPTNEAYLVNIYTHEDLEEHHFRIREKMIHAKSRIENVVHNFRKCLRRHKEVEQSFERIMDDLRQIAAESMEKIFLESAAI